MARLPHPWTRPMLVDVAVGVGAVAVDIAGAAIDAHQDPGGPSLTVPGVALLGAAGLTLVARRRWPFAVALVVGLLTLAYGLAELPDPPLRAPCSSPWPRRPTGADGARPCSSPPRSSSAVWPAWR